jgi:hypothetical protein
MRSLAAILLAIAPCVAVADTGNELFARCVSSQIGEQLYCMGYVTGIANALRDDGKVCIPAAVTKQQVMDMVIAHMRAYPAARHMDSYWIIYAALLEGFACPKK